MMWPGCGSLGWSGMHIFRFPASESATVRASPLL
jgi:hypothetical protein